MATQIDENEPSIGGFVKYLVRGKKLPSEVRAEQTAAPESGIEMLRDKEKKAQSRTNKALEEAGAMKKGGRVKKAKCMARGGGVEVRGKTKGRFV